MITVETTMRHLLSITMLFLVNAPAFADMTVVDIVPVPEPGVLGLIGTGALAILVSRRVKK